MVIDVLKHLETEATDVCSFASEDGERGGEGAVYEKASVARGPSWKLGRGHMGVGFKFVYDFLYGGECSQTNIGGIKHEAIGPSQGVGPQWLA